LKVGKWAWPKGNLAKEDPAPRGTVNSETSTTEARENKSCRGKRCNHAASVDACILVSVDMVHKNAMGVVLQTTRLQTAPRRHGIDKVAHKVQAREITQSCKEAALLRMQSREATEVEKGCKQVTECFL